MAKGYWICFYRSISEPDTMPKYAALAASAILTGGGKFLTRSTAVEAYEAGLKQRTVTIEFESVEQAIATHNSPEYQAALKILGNAAERDLRIVEGVE